MSTRKTTLFYALLLMTASLFVGMVIASRLDLAPRSTAQTIAVPAMNSAPVTGPLDAQTFRNVAKMANPIVVNIRTEMKTKTQDLTDFFGGGPCIELCRFALAQKFAERQFQELQLQAPDLLVFDILSSPKAFEPVAHP